jgi:cyclin-dependent kinase 8/11
MADQHSLFLSWKASKDLHRKKITDSYKILGFISSGTYGRVYKAERSVGSKSFYAIKKFKPDKEGDDNLKTGLSQSACREIGLCRELRHINVVALEEVFLGPIDRSIYMIFDYAEHDFLQILHHHCIYISIALIDNSSRTNSDSYFYC